MSIIQTYQFTNAANFTLDNTQIESNLGKLGLVPNPSQTFSNDFSSDTGFTYNSSEVEFSGGMLQQKDQSAANSVLAGKMVTKDLTWRKDAGSLVGVLHGVPTFGTGKMVCTGAQGASWEYTTTAIETHKFKYTPNYTGAPPANINLLTLWNGSNNNDRFYMTNSPSGNNIRFDLINSSGSAVTGLTVLAGFPAVAGTEYEFEVVLDSVAGTVRLFIDGVLSGTSALGAWTRGGVSSRARLGASTLVYNRSEGSFDDYIVFDNAQHTSSYTPGYSIVDLLYVGSKVDGPPFVYTGIGTVLSVDSGTVIESGAPRYIVGLQYFDGVDWVVSDGSYAQANTFATILANLASFNTGGAGILPWSVVFTESNTISSIDDFEVEVTGEKYAELGTITPVMAINAQALSSYIHTIVTGANSDLKLAIRVGTANYYHDGADWVESDLTIAQGNTATEANNNLATLPLTENSEVKPIWILSSSLATETSTIEESTIDYDFGGIAPNAPARCNVYGYIIDSEGTPIEGATVSIDLSPDAPQVVKAASRLISQTLSKVTDENGYFEMNLIRSSEYDSITPVQYQLTWSKDDEEILLEGSQFIYFDVPDLESYNVTDGIQGA